MWTRIAFLFGLLACPLFALNLVRTETRVDEAFLRWGYTGKGVAIAILDSGIDWTIRDLRNDDGTTRIAYIFDLTDDSGATAAGNSYGMGTIYTRDQINAALKNKTGSPTRDAVGRGTADATIAAGNGKALASQKYRGIAPEATIIAVKLFSEGAPAHDGQAAEAPYSYNPQRISVALDFIAAKAKELGMPAVVVLNSGSIGGPTDGTSALDRKIDTIFATAPGLALITGSGNDGGIANRAGGTITQGQSGDVTIQKGTGAVRFDLWYSGSDAFAVTIHTPDTTYGPFAAPAASDVRSGLGELSYAQYGPNAQSAWASNNGKREITIDLTGPAGNYIVTLTGSTVKSGRFDATLAPLDPTAQPATFLTYVASGSISDVGSARNAITTATEVVRTSWVDIDHITRTATSQGDATNLWTLSSSGPTFDARNGIDVTAPGQNIVTAYSPTSYWGSIRSNLIEDGLGLYGIAGSDTAANSVVAGIVALMLQANPKLDDLTIQDILHKSTRIDTATGVVPNTQWGYGRIDALNALSAVLNTAPPNIQTNGIANGASFQAGAVAPGEVFTIFGSAMGPLKLTTLEYTSDLAVSKSLSGTEVLFDGVPAPLLYTSGTQVAGVVPYSVAGRQSTSVQVVYEGVASAATNVPVAPASPALFLAPGLGFQQAAAFNQDNVTHNSAQNPAARGSFIVLFGTGAGVMTPAVPDGVLVNGVYPKTTLPVSVTIGGVAVPAANIAYAGAAPSLVNGALQINVKIPENAPAGPSIPVIVTIGSVSSPAASISIQ